MSAEAHIIDIDRLVLAGADLRHPGQMTARIEAEIRRALEGTILPVPPGLLNEETNVAGEVARTVVRSIQGGSNDV